MKCQLKKGDKLRLFKPLGQFLDVNHIGEMCTVTSHIDGRVNYITDSGYHGWIADHLVETYFNPYRIGQKVKVVKNTCEMPLKIGGEYIIEEVKYGVVLLIPISDDDSTMYYIAVNVFNECFEMLEFEDKKQEINEEFYSLTPDDIDTIMDNCDLNVTTVFGKCTTVACKLPNGFVIVESSACVDAKNYDEHIGLEICLNRIRDKVWELEGYRLQQKMYEDATKKSVKSTDDQKSCTCNEDCDLCEPKQSFCPYHCDSNCDNCERHKED